MPSLLSLFSLDELSASHLRRQHSQSFTQPPTPPLLPLFPDKTVARIEERISSLIFVPKEYGKPLQAKHIGPEEAKQQYHYFGNKSRFSEPVMAIVILYLSNVSQGGQILFPESELGNSQMKNKILSDCTKSSYALRPTRGNALLFFNLHPNTTPDQSSSHARCPVLDGDMWFATKFFHVKASDVQTI
ncbi:hypothetical protein RJ639_009159 [Escallonia herrerae]|uniref:Prolyl 4-hydroxylase alpha subunit domain-containing protein n=1 Tax=Escallonia herrerae TaxID=1293975 RepID=A0AA88VVR8_9ASTE|nr:hypothetical protein RJ639_009159 [Escallonia herrerae]